VSIFNQETRSHYSFILKAFNSRRSFQYKFPWNIHVLHRVTTILLRI